MGMFFGVVGFVGLLVFLVLGIIAAVKKKENTKKYFIYSGIAFVLFVFGVSTSIKDDPVKPTSTEVSIEKVDKPPVQEPKKEEKPKKEEPKKSDGVFDLGTEVHFESGLVVKAVKVTTTSERNQFEDPSKHVAVVHLELGNTTDAEITLTSHEFNVIDKEGFQGKPYASGDQIVTLAPNGKAKVEFHYAIDGEGPYKVTGGVATWE